MEQPKIHIVSFDVPYPPNYGGVIDVFYKIKALHELGCEVTLHCFDYGRGKQTELNTYCKQVNYYPRNTGILKFLSPLPYIVNTRNSKGLLQNLLLDNAPILFEGLHSCYLLSNPQLKDRFKIVRSHNIEHDYYANLEKSEKSFFKKLYFKIESKRLLKFEQQVEHASAIAAISANDAYHFKRKFKRVSTISAFHPYDKVAINQSNGSYALYHGNLAVAENNMGALYLVNEVFNKIKVPLIIAGSGPSNELKNAIEKHPHIQLRGDISTPEINDLIEHAHINVLPTFQATGIKLKLLAALFSGKYCVVNTPMVANTGLETLCSIKDTPAKMAQKIEQLMSMPFTDEDVANRKRVLEKDFSNKHNALALLALLPAK